MKDDVGCYEGDCIYFSHHFLNNCEKYRKVSFCEEPCIPNKDNSDNLETLENPFDYQVGGNHYKTGKEDGLMDVTEWCMRHNIGPAEFNVIKYTFRHEGKGEGIKDLRKAKHYLEFIAYIKYDENL